MNCSVTISLSLLSLIKFIVTNHISNYIIKNYQYYFLDCVIEYFCTHNSYHSSTEWKPFNHYNVWDLQLHTYLRYWYFVLYASLACKEILSRSGWWFIRLSYAFVFTDAEPPSISILFCMDDQKFVASIEYALIRVFFFFL